MLLQSPTRDKLKDGAEQTVESSANRIYWRARRDLNPQPSDPKND
jgi:hypothetical protein